MTFFTAPPTPPSSSNPSGFDAAADAYVAWQTGTHHDELNEFIVAFNTAQYSSVSTTSLSVGTGSKSLTIETGKSLLPGMLVVCARTAAPTNWMGGQVTSYDSATGALVFTSSVSEGSGTFTDWTITLGASGTLVPRDPDYTESIVLGGSAIPLTTGVTVNVTSISLGAGNWDVFAVGSFGLGGSTVFSQLIAGISTTSATLPTRGKTSRSETKATHAAGKGSDVSAATYLELASPATVYLVAQAAFTVDTAAVFGQIWAVRR